MKILDAHTHLSGSETDENTEGIVACLDACHVDKAFVFAPLLNVHSWELTDGHLDDIFWPLEPEQYLEQYLYPQRGLFEVAVTNGHIASEGSPSRKELREQIFYKNVYEHWQSAVREPQQPQRAKRKIKTPQAKTSHGHKSGRRS
jgi:hypothetical protein